MRPGPLSVALILAGALALGGAAWFAVRHFGAQPGRVVSVAIAGNQLRIDSDYLPAAEAAADGERHEINVVARFPDFRPGRGRALSRAGREQGVAREIVITLMAPDEALDPVERPAKLYGRFLEGDVWSHPGGLVMRRFESGSPYENEELYIAPPDGRAFSARCMRPAQPPDGLSEMCLADLRQAGLQARIRFAPELLTDWQTLINGARGLIRSFQRAG